MKINNIGYHHVHDADFIIERPDGSGDYLLVLLKTSAIFTFDGVDVVTPDNSVILFKKDSPQYYRADGSQFANNWFHFDMSDEDLYFLKSLEIPFDKVISLSDINDLSLLVQNMCFERYSENLYKDDSIQLYMRLFFIKLSEKIHATERSMPNSYHNKLSIVRTNIYNMPQNDWNIAGLAHQLTMSKSYFQHLYKEQFGISVMEDIIQSRIDRAKYLLSSTDFPIVQISELCGYKCSSHFMRQFKLRMKATPSEYRQKSKGRNTQRNKRWISETGSTNSS